jgi:hypothetical protein
METWVVLVAVTESVDELPDAIAAGLAVMLTVGGGVVEPVTVTVAAADTLPETPVATAVYVVVLAGLTACVPPVEVSWYELPSDPLTVTVAALAAVTVRVDEAPAAIETGDATMLTVAGLTMLTWVPPQPATRNANRRLPTRYERNWREILEKCAESKSVLHSVAQKSAQGPLGVPGTRNAIRPATRRRTSRSVTQFKNEGLYDSRFGGL